MSLLPPETSEPSSAHPLPFREALATWLKVGLLSFGGPAGQIAVMHRLLVEEKRWVREERFLAALNYCMLLPGPEAQQLATYLGWLLHGLAGGLAAGVLFVLPGALVMLALAALYASFSGVGVVAAIFWGIKPAVLAIVVEALLRIGRRALGTPVKWGLAALAFVALFFFGVRFPWVIAAAGLAGALAAVLGLPGFAPGGGRAAPGAAEEAAPVASWVEERAAKLQVGWRSTLATVFVWAALWWLPVLALLALLGRGNVFVESALFFALAAMVTFGGAYAVLAYVAQRVVSGYGWLSAGEMLDGLGLAETTPGPLILVLQFVGFLAAYHRPGGLPPLLAGTLGALLTLWVTFLPSFLWIFAGAPHLDRVQRRPALAGALAAITAAVVGVVMNLTLWLALQVLFPRGGHPGPASLPPLPMLPGLDGAAALLAGAALVATLRFRVGMGWLLAGAGLAGILWQRLSS